MMAEKKKTIQINPLDITESLGYTTFRRDSRKPWTKEEDVRLSELVNDKLVELGYENGIRSLTLESWDVNQTQLPQEIDWESIGEILQTRKPKDCRKRWTNSLDPNLKKGKWTKEEDEMLLISYNKHGSSWQKISLDIPGRTDDQCAKRYIEVLDPNTKDRLRPWKLDEDLQLIRKVKIYGTKWRTISLEMKSRPSLTCRNRWRKIVTEVVRGKASPEIKKELDSIQGGLSALDKINENLEKQRQTQLTDISNGVDKQQASNQDPYNRQKPHRGHENGHVNGQLSSYGGSSNSNLPPGIGGESPKPNTTEMDWKYTLKDTSGLTLSNGNISTTDLAKQLIENAKKYDLKISVHQHIHHHYAQSNTLAKGQSPVESTTSQNSGNNAATEELITPNRYSHFNYLPPMVQPQLGSSSTMMSKENDLARLLNPQNRQHHQDQSRSSSKRKLSSSSNNSRGKQRQSSQIGHNVNSLDGKSSSHRQPSINQDELEDELDFWETMRSLSEVTNNRRLNNNNNNLNQKGRHSVPQYNQYNTPADASNTNGGAGDFGLYYSVFGEEDELEDDEFKEDIRDIEGLAGILPFNPS